jgi:hypothetical protein
MNMQTQTQRPRLNWTKRYNGSWPLNDWFCQYKMQGWTLDEITERFMQITGLEREALVGPLRLVNMRHDWLVYGWCDHVNERRNVYRVAKRAYIDEFMSQGGIPHEDVRPAIRGFYGGDYFPE